ncbi:hypothetical protein CEXT_10811 [Caerostris extrusa]|uniref:Uncharacterized protein n=1 Tax=Caerostris extrusa TaxID=172846 RepID=A0AAV4NQ00_CAEEX|nr:hypothetical protein CEXT_10811 [Caerostris extrusa]
MTLNSCPNPDGDPLLSPVGKQSPVFVLLPRPEQTGGSAVSSRGAFSEEKKEPILRRRRNLCENGISHAYTPKRILGDSTEWTKKKKKKGRTAGMLDSAC